MTRTRFSISLEPESVPESSRRSSFSWEGAGNFTFGSRTSVDRSFFLSIMHSVDDSVSVDLTLDSVLQLAGLIDALYDEEVESALLSGLSRFFKKTIRGVVFRPSSVFNDTLVQAVGFEKLIAGCDMNGYTFRPRLFTERDPQSMASIVVGNEFPSLAGLVKFYSSRSELTRLRLATELDHYLSFACTGAVL